jgi:hypothetical protein
MKSLHLLIGVTALTLSCGGGTPEPNPNPKQLWLALNGSERAEQLLPVQPEPF